MIRRPKPLRAQRAIDDLGRILERSRKRRSVPLCEGSGTILPLGMLQGDGRGPCFVCGRRVGVVDSGAIPHRLADHTSSRTGPKPRDGVPRTETRRFRCTEAQAAEIDAACEAAGRDLSDVTRELLLAWARQR